MKLPGMIFPVAALVAALFVSGCGGDSGDSGSAAGSTAAASTGPLTKAEFIKQADRICKKADDRVYYGASAYRETHAKELNKLEPIPREEKMIRVFVLPSIERQIAEIESLEAPKGDEQKIEAILAELKAGLKYGEKKPYSVSYEEPSEYPFAKLSELAREYGFNECSNPT